jgi:steroid 5-alpha reductase family enzyme
MLCWIGIWVSACSILVGAEWASVVSPLYIINILLFLSGLNRLERSADDKYVDRV